MRDETVGCASAAAAKPKNITSIAAPSSLKILPQAPAQPAQPSPPEELEYNPEPQPQELTADEVEAEVLCNQLESQLKGSYLASYCLGLTFQLLLSPHQLKLCLLCLTSISACIVLD